ncbi:hypothetical protein [Ewingella americana]|uniref:hypothetical protein n=1 Tax=Ewingella americana TaxID=41202 RepID=UPI000FE1A6DB|nr:hypothetical protein [Ewingella americana]KAA8730224.1 hypothetical protein F4W05_08560 [Ewingella americana]
MKQSDGAYSDCTISNGQVTSCRSWSQGSAVVQQSDGSYYSCTIANGQVTSCGSWYQGSAIVDR